MHEITLSGPGKNALGTATMQFLLDELAKAAGRPVLLTGAGDGFSAGLNLKELAQLDGAFVISGDGVVISAARYIDVSSEGVALPLGYGSRHVASPESRATSRTLSRRSSSTFARAISTNGPSVS